MNLSRYSEIAGSTFTMVIFLVGSINAVKAEPTTCPSTQPGRGTILLGTVSNDDGSCPPFTGVEISPPDEVKSQKRGKMLFFTVTNQVGAFAFDEYIPPGNYSIRVFDDGEVIASQILVISSDAKALTTTIEIQTFKASLEGCVFLDSGKPADGVEVLLNESSGLRYMTKTDKTGHYKFGHLVAGNYTVSAVVDGKLGRQHIEKRIELDKDCEKINLSAQDDGAV